MEKFDIDQENSLISMNSFSSSMYTIIEARLNNIKRRTQAMMKFICTIDDDIFFR